MLGKVLRLNVTDPYISENSKTPVALLATIHVLSGKSKIEVYFKMRVPVSKLTCLSLIMWANLSLASSGRGIRIDSLVLN